MIKRLFLAAFLPLALAAATVTMGSGGSAEAAPAGAAQNLAITNQSCLSNGTVNATMQWSPSGRGIQFAELSNRNDGFKLPYSSSGVLGSGQAVANFTQLTPGATYYARVTTLDGNTWKISDTLVFTAGCGAPSGAPTAPIHLQAAATSASSIRVQWVPGNNNIWSCVDTATNLFDLYYRTGSWRSNDCWSTDAVADIGGLQCGTTYYYRIYTWNYVSFAESGVAQISTAPCHTVISPPTNLSATPLSPTEVRFDWTKGNNNIWSCVDTATSAHNLYTRSGDWVSHGCWTTGSSITVDDLKCDTTYFWRVYSWNQNTWTETTHRTVTTPDCENEPHDVIAQIDDVDVVKVGDSYRAEIIVGLSGGCESPGSYRVERSGDEIDITVWNRHSGDDVCTLEYRTYELHVNLGSNFTVGETYEVEVNDDESDFFTAS